MIFFLLEFNCFRGWTFLFVIPENLNCSGDEHKDDHKEDRTIGNHFTGLPCTVEDQKNARTVMMSSEFDH